MKRLILCIACCAAALTGPAPVRAAETLDEVQKRVVKIFGAGGIKNLYAYSSGFLISPEGHIATIWNHVLDADSVAVVLSDGRRFQAKVVGAEPQLNLAVIKLQETEGQTFPYFKLDKARDVQPGTRVLAFSNMFKVATGDEPVSVVHGVIAARTKLAARRGAFEVPYDGDVYILDATTNNSGAGGGLITTRRGFPVAMIGRELRNSESNTWVHYSVPLTVIRDVINDIVTGNYSARTNSAEIDKNPRRFLPTDLGFQMLPNVVNRTPAYVERVLPNSQAAKAGLQPDDLVLFVNDNLVQSCGDLLNHLGRLEDGDRTRIVLRRGDKLITVDLTAEKGGQP